MLGGHVDNKAKERSQSVKSIYDLARQTGLATSTISRVLNQRGRISMETRQRVLVAARDAGFKPRMSVRETAVAVVIDRIHFSVNGGFTASLLTFLIEQLAEKGVAVEVYTETSVSRLGSRFIDGVIAMSWDDATVAQFSHLKGVPVVIINRLDLDDFSAVASDHYQGGRLVGECLLRHGHSRIAFLGEERDWGANQRVQGLSDAMRAEGAELMPEMVAFTQHQSVRESLEKLLKSKPTALFLAGEDLALEGTFLLGNTLGVKIPDEMSVIGLESSKVSQFTSPPLTTLSQPLSKIARSALEVVMEQVESGSSIPKRILLENSMIERESVSQVPRGGR